MIPENKSLNASAQSSQRFSSGQLKWLLFSCIIVKFALNQTLGITSGVIVKGAWKKGLSDTWCSVKFSFCFTSKYKAISKENLVVNQMSLRPFFPRTLLNYLVFACETKRGIWRYINCTFEPNSMNPFKLIFLIIPQSLREFFSDLGCITYRNINL